MFVSQIYSKTNSYDAIKLFFCIIFFGKDMDSNRRTMTHAYDSVQGSIIDIIIQVGRNS